LYWRRRQLARNLEMGGRTLKRVKTPLMLRPIRLASRQLQDRGEAFPPSYFHQAWCDRLYLDVEIEA
jgi:hypothetical protein